jgi:hypothetical protein
MSWKQSFDVKLVCWKELKPDAENYLSILVFLQLLTAENHTVNPY